MRKMNGKVPAPQEKVGGHCIDKYSYLVIVLFFTVVVGDAALCQSLTQSFYNLKIVYN